MKHPIPADLSPAKWIWLPSQRTLPNTFVLFRRPITLSRELREAKGWIAADSRYRLTVNGRRVQWGPGPGDPRWPEADPVDLGEYLRPGENVIGVEVLFYGHGDGTWPMGKPGLLFLLELSYGKGEGERIISDRSWECHVDYAHRPGQYKRWFLRALQEEYDARLHPFGWDRPGYEPAGEHLWPAAGELACPADKPSICSDYPDYLYDSQPAGGEDTGLLCRSIPLLREERVFPAERVLTGKVLWKAPAEHWFDFRIPGSFFVEEGQERRWQGALTVEPAGGENGAILTFSFPQQVVGWPFFTVDAEEGTVVELLCQEAHDPGACAWLDNQFFSWSRFICAGGENTFEPFDFESLRWMQLHIRGNKGAVTVKNVGIRRRLYPWGRTPKLETADLKLQKLFEAGINTVCNNAQETLVDGMARERQQYLGDQCHELFALRYWFGEQALVEKYLRDVTRGLTKEGYFFDSWPGYDRIVRIPQRQLGLTPWGPIVDHGVQLVIEHWNHYMETGMLETAREALPSLLAFDGFLQTLLRQDGLLAVEGTGVPYVWLDHEAYRLQRHKKCAFNLYACAMYLRALAPLAQALDSPEAGRLRRQGEALRKAVIAVFWNEEEGLFVANRPWREEEGERRLCDRSLATAVVYDLCPGGRTGPAVEALAQCPAELGLSYPCNAVWRYWALAKGNRGDVVLSELRSRWYTMKSVGQNNTLQEMWQVVEDAPNQWSHASVAPLNAIPMYLLGLTPVTPGYKRCELRPRLWDIPALQATLYTAVGPVWLRAEQEGEGHRLEVDIPPHMECLLIKLDGAGIPLQQGRNNGILLPGTIRP